jgi:biotin synthase
VKSEIADFGRQVLDNEPLSRPQILSLVSAGTQDPYELLYWAHQVRQANFGMKVAFCSIISGKTGGCSEDCKWCSQSAVSSSTPEGPQKASFADISSAAQDAANNHAGCFCVVHSGRGPSVADVSAVAAAVSDIQPAARAVGMCVSASLGELNAEKAAELAGAGVKRYNHNLETSRRFYSQVVSSHTYDDRLATLRTARQAGMQLCSGGIFGLGETWEDRIDLAITLRDEVHPTITPLNFLHPIPGTPLENNPQVPPLEILTIIAIFRLILPKVDLKICGGRPLNMRDMQSWMFYAGATSCLVGNYLTTLGRYVEDDIQMIKDLGLEIVRNFD